MLLQLAEAVESHVQSGVLADELVDFGDVDFSQGVASEGSVDPYGVGMVRQGGACDDGGVGALL